MTSHSRQNPGVLVDGDRDVEPHPAQNAVVFNWKACEAGRPFPLHGGQITLSVSRLIKYQQSRNRQVMKYITKRNNNDLTVDAIMTDQALIFIPFLV